jgi:AcrR family transcriptional regulator
MSSVKSRREQYSQATRAALLRAAAKRFAEHGFAGTALEDVAADIQATRGAVYHHFTSKKALFEAVFEELEGQAVQRTAAAGLAAGDAWNGSVAAVNAFLETCCDPVYGRIVWQEAPIALGWQRWKECEEKLAYGLVEQFVRALMDGGHIVAMPVETTSRITYALLGAAGQALAEAAEDDKPRVKAEYAAAIRRLLEGLRAPSQ